MAAGSEVQLARGIQNSVLHIWLADDSAPVLGQQRAPHQRAAGPAASPCNGALRESSSGDTTEGSSAAAKSSMSSDSGGTSPVEAAQPTNQWPAGERPNIPEVGDAAPGSEAEACSMLPAKEQLAAGLEAVPPPAAATVPFGTAAAPAARGMLAVVDPLKAFRLSSAAVHMLFMAAASSAAPLPCQVALTCLIGPPGKVGRHTALHLQQ